ncbi:MAG: MarR family winged helix-turn-helix transcriptional regulator [Limisphaerales bacterium]
MELSENLSKPQYEMLAAFRYSLRCFIHFSEQAAATVGLTPQQHQAMLAIKGFPGRNCVTIGELAERLQLRHNSAVGLVDRMVAERLLEREVPSEDRRKVLIRLSPAAEEKLEKLSAMHRQELAQVGPELSGLLERLNMAAR